MLTNIGLNMEAGNGPFTIVARRYTVCAVSAICVQTALALFAVVVTCSGSGHDAHDFLIRLASQYSGLTIATRGRAKFGKLERRFSPTVERCCLRLRWVVNRQSRYLNKLPLITQHLAHSFSLRGTVSMGETEPKTLRSVLALSPFTRSTRDALPYHAKAAAL